MTTSLGFRHSRAIRSMVSCYEEVVNEGDPESQTTGVERLDLDVSISVAPSAVVVDAQVVLVKPAVSQSRRVRRYEGFRAPEAETLLAVEGESEAAPGFKAVEGSGGAMAVL